MFKKSVTPEDVVELLNEIVKIDPTLARSLLFTRIPCTKELCDHPTIQVARFGVVGTLGILNGIFGINENGWGCILADIDDSTGYINKFYVDYNGKNAEVK